MYIIKQTHEEECNKNMRINTVKDVMMKYMKIKNGNV